MNYQHASRTAEFMALFRALESTSPAEHRLFTDVFAHGFLRPSLRLLVQMARLRLLGILVSQILDWRWPGARTSGIARTRYIDDACLEAIAAGFQQVVILGAGFDARAYRLPGMEKVRVFEVDHPVTLAAKQRLLHHVFAVLPSHVTFVSVDFTEHRLDEVMRIAGFDSTCRTLFLWEGVTNYLSAEAVDAMFHFVRTTASGSRILFTYIHRDVLDHPAAFSGTRSLVRTLRQVGESWTFGFDPDALPAYLQQRGLVLLADVGSVEYRARYLGKAQRHLHGYTFYRLALAEVKPRSGTNAILTPATTQTLHTDKTGA
ncbi:MAG: SAM-dependent methyltransferase [Ktedonobacterales bacterium]